MPILQIMRHRICFTRHGELGKIFRDGQEEYSAVCRALTTYRAIAIFGGHSICRLYFDAVAWYCDSAASMARKADGRAA